MTRVAREFLLGLQKKKKSALDIGNEHRKTVYLGSSGLHLPEFNKTLAFSIILSQTEGKRSGYLDIVDLKVVILS